MTGARGQRGDASTAILSRYDGEPSGTTAGQASGATRAARARLSVDNDSRKPPRSAIVLAVPNRPPPLPPIAWPRSRAELRAKGVSERALREGKGWQRTGCGFYVPAGVDVASPQQRIGAQAVRLPDDTAIGGWGSAYLQGARMLDGRGLNGKTPLPLLLVLGRHGRLRSSAEADVSREPLERDEIVEVHGVRVTAALRTCFDGMRLAPNLVEAVVFADAMLYAECCEVGDLDAYIAEHGGWRGVRQARKALALCDANARNPWETRLRMVWMLDARLPRPLVNPPVFDLHGVLLGHPDLLDAGAGTVFEYDGSGHREEYQHASDNNREEVFEDHLLLVGRVTRVDMHNRRAVARRMVAKRRRGLGRDRSADRWTLQLPSDWGGCCPESELHEVLEEMDRGWSPWTAPVPPAW